MKSFQSWKAGLRAWQNGAISFQCSPAGPAFIALGRWGCCCCYPGEEGCSWWGKEFGLHYHSGLLLLGGNRDCLQQQFQLEAVWDTWSYLWKSSPQCLRGNQGWKQQNSSHALDLRTNKDMINLSNEYCVSVRCSSFIKPQQVAESTHL